MRRGGGARLRLGVDAATTSRSTTRSTSRSPCSPPTRRSPAGSSSAPACICSRCARPPSRRRSRPRSTCCRAAGSSSASAWAARTRRSSRLTGVAAQGARRARHRRHRRRAHAVARHAGDVQRAASPKFSGVSIDPKPVQKPGPADLDRRPLGRRARAGRPSGRRLDVLRRQAERFAQSLDKIHAAAAGGRARLDGFVAAHLTFITVGRDYETRARRRGSRLLASATRRTSARSPAGTASSARPTQCAGAARALPRGGLPLLRDGLDLRRRPRSRRSSRRSPPRSSRLRSLPRGEPRAVPRGRRAARALTADILEVDLAMDEPAALRFEAGQWISVPFGPKTVRAYSIASTPPRQRRITLCGGRGAGRASGPRGFAAWRRRRACVQGAARRLRRSIAPMRGGPLFVAEEIGIVPIRVDPAPSSTRRASTRPATLVYWARDPAWLLYDDDFRARWRARPGLRLSSGRRSAAAGWRGSAASVARPSIGRVRPATSSPTCAGGGATIDTRARRS